MLRVLIVDDEPLARLRLRRAVEAADGAEVVGEAANGTDACRAIEALAPAVVLLDIQMPDGDGFDVLARTIRGANVPEIIFVTAHDGYAVAAFEHGATDYLMKPVSFERLAQALDRAAMQLRRRSAAERADQLSGILHRLERNAGPASDKAPDLWIKESGKSVRLAIDDIFAIAADRDYVRILARERLHYVRGRITEFEEKLADAGFLRVHRSWIVRLDRIVSLSKDRAHGWAIELEGGQSVPVGRSFIGRVRAVRDDRPL